MDKRLLIIFDTPEVDIPTCRAISAEGIPLKAVYRRPIGVPITLIWGAKDGALSARVAMNSALDAGREVDLRPLPSVGHFVSLEAPADLAREVERIISAG